MLLEHKKIIVTGGPTREWIDPVRYISNASSGKMGIALADAAYAISEYTIFIHGPIDNSLLKGKEYRKIAVESTNEMLCAVIEELTGDTVLIMSAAPADYAPLKKSEHKIKKESEELQIDLKKNPDILKNVAKKRFENPDFKNIFVVGFAAETHNIEKYAVGKLKEKNLDMICLNDVGRSGAGFAGDTNIITLFTRDGRREDIPLLSKKECAIMILQRIEMELEKH